MLRAIVLLCVLLAGGGTVAAPDEAATHTIDPGRRFQTIDHFGASGCWTIRLLEHWPATARERVADLLFSRDKGIGLSLWRFHLGAGHQPARIKMPLRTVESFEVGAGRYDWSRMAIERWMLRAAKARGVARFHAFSLSPPSRLTRNGFVNADAGTHTTNLKAGAESGYARYLADILEHFERGYPKAERIVFDWISPFNEPQWDWIGGAHGGTRWSNDDMRRVAHQLGRTLAKRKLRAKVHLAESGTIPDMVAIHAKATTRYGARFGAYVDAFAGDDALAPLLDRTLGYHSYWSDAGAVFWPHRAGLRRKLDAYPHWRVFQTEYCVMQWGRDLGMDTALHVARVMHGDLAIVNVSGWSWWLALSPHDFKDGLLYTDWRKPGDAPSILPSKTFWALGNHSRFVRPGMQRVAIAGDGLQDHAGLLATAWRDETGSRLVVVYVNSGRTPRRVRLAVAGSFARPEVQRCHVTSAAPGDDLRSSPPQSPGSLLLVPARAVVTVVLE